MLLNSFTRPAAGALAFLVCNLSFGEQATGLDRGPLTVALQHYVDDHVMAGAVMLVADKTGIVDLETVGYSDIKTQKPMKVDDLFWIASMSKTFTAAALMMLVDEGRVRIDDPVEKYIPAFKDVKVAQPDGTLVSPSHPLLIREILSHTSGLRFLNSKDRQVIDSVPLETSIKDDLLEPLLFDPGTKYTYSNEGIDTAGRIIEIVTGTSYEQFMQDRLIAPLNLVDTTFHPSAAQLQRLAKSYRMTPDKSGLEEAPIHYLKYPLDGPARYAAPGGGLFSTARDVCRFCQMLANGGALDGRIYLSTESVHQMTIKQTGPKVTDAYGFGIQVHSDGNSFGHGGADKTFMWVDHGQVRVFLVQQASGWSKGDPNKDFGTAAQQLMKSRTGSASHADNSSAYSAPVGMQVPAK
jgi:CubicO group peptidase (beta-lactamase class C family)